LEDIQGSLLIAFLVLLLVVFLGQFELGRF
jgi:hypothetical protein